MTPTITAFRDSPDGGKGLARDMRVRWALEEVGQPHAVRLVSMPALKQSAHLALNPFGSIPTYEEGELSLFESGAIVLHIADRHEVLLPNDANARKRVIAWMFVALNAVEPPIVERKMSIELERDDSWCNEGLPSIDDRARDRIAQAIRPSRRSRLARQLVQRGRPADDRGVAQTETLNSWIIGKEKFMKHKILHHLTIPGESAEYRAARNKLLAEEMALRRQIEAVAALRRALPAGGTVAQDYLFDGDNGSSKLSDLFKPGMDTLAIYSFMYGPEKELPCTGCTHFLDGLEGMVQHITQRINLAVVAKSPLPRLLGLARARGWRTLPLLSTHGNSYDRDYFGDSSGLPDAVLKQQKFKNGKEWDMPMLNVFHRRGKVIRHFWGSELLYVPAEPGQEYRHNDALDALWSMLDLTPAGRGDFHPQLSYPPVNSK